MHIYFFIDPKLHTFSLTYMHIIFLCILILYQHIQSSDLNPSSNALMTEIFKALDDHFGVRMGVWVVAMEMPL